MTAGRLRFHHGGQSVLLMVRMFVNLCRQLINHLTCPIKGCFMPLKLESVVKKKQPAALLRYRDMCTFWSGNCSKSYTLTQTLGFPAASDWVAAHEELTPANRYCIKNLTADDLLHVRVVAVNPGGRSEPGTLAGPVPIREVAGE